MKKPILSGEAVVCPHSRKWIDCAMLAFGMDEADVVERIVNGWVHAWHEGHEVALHTSYAELADTIRREVEPRAHKF